MVPAVGALPTFAEAPALIVVGSLMMTTVREVNWDDPLVASPAFLTMVTIPRGKQGCRRGDTPEMGACSDRARIREGGC